jgi:hypothetical protein
MRPGVLEHTSFFVTAVEPPRACVLDARRTQIESMFTGAGSTRLGRLIASLQVRPRHRDRVGQ